MHSITSVTKASPTPPAPLPPVPPALLVPNLDEYEEPTIGTPFPEAPGVGALNGLFSTPCLLSMLPSVGFIPPPSPPPLTSSSNPPRPLRLLKKLTRTMISQITIVARYVSTTMVGNSVLL